MIDHKNRMDAVQYVRAFAALAVLHYHIGSTVQSAYGSGFVTVDHWAAAGVDMFFVLSGFLMAYILCSQTGMTAAQFLRKRIVRIAPLYYAATIGVFLIGLVLPSLLNSEGANLWRLLTSLAFVPPGVGDAPTTPLLLVGWTLNYEFFFYVLVGLSLAIGGRNWLPLCTLVMLALIAAGVALAPSNPIAAFYTDPILLEFILGFVVYKLWQSQRAQNDTLFYVAVSLSAIGLLLGFDGAGETSLRAIVWGIPAAMLVYATLGLIKTGNVVLRTIGDWSYALYLSHVFVVVAFVRILIPALPMEELNWFVLYAAIMLTSVVAAGFIHTFVEPILTAFAKTHLPDFRLPSMRRNPAH